MAKMSIQLYTLRDEAKDDLEKVLKFCHEQGFDGVEFAGFYGHSKETVKEWLDKYNLVATSAHVPFSEMEQDINAVMEYHKYIGNDRIIIPHTMAKDEESTNEVIEKAKPIAKTLIENGFKFSYHNHAHEMKSYNGKTILEHLYDGIEGMTLELDTFWVYAGGYNPREFILAQKDKLAEVIHIKDGFSFKSADDEFKAKLSTEAMEFFIEKDMDYVPTAVGLGTSPIEQTMATVKELSIPWIVLENDFPFPKCFENVETSVKKLKELL